jgi:hypothetical protein
MATDFSEGASPYTTPFAAGLISEDSCAWLARENAMQVRRKNFFIYSVLPDEDIFSLSTFMLIPARSAVQPWRLPQTSFYQFFPRLHCW